MRLRTKTYTLLWCMALSTLCLLSCTVMDDLPADPTVNSGASGGRVQLTLDISTPEATAAMTRSIPVENDTVLCGTFAVFGFDSNDKLLFVAKNEEVNDSSNLSGYTDSPAIAWHPNEGSHSGRLYVEAEETAEEVHLLVIANVDTDKVGELLTDGTIAEGMSLTEVAEGLDKGLAIDVTDDDMKYIPMAGECDLENGITLGSKGSISMRRSLARFTVRVEYTLERLALDYNSNIEEAPFAGADTVKLVNVNRYAAVYSPNTDKPYISALNDEDAGTIDMKFALPTGWTLGTDREGSEVLYKELVFYVAETVNSRVDAFLPNETTSEMMENTENPRISLLVSGEYHDYDGDTLTNNTYRLDLIPETAASEEYEREFIMRNYNYIFVVRDAVNRGSDVEEQALRLTIPDNFPFNREVDNDIYVVIEDEDILSITAEWFTTEGNDPTPYYIGVSSTQAEMPRSEGACVRVKVVTNFPGWTIDPYGIPEATGHTTDGGNTEFSFSFIRDDDANTLWVWLDYPEAVTVGDTYTYYLVAGNIRKKMRITITEGTYEDTP